MSDEHTPSSAPPASRKAPLHGLLAEYDSPKAILHAAEKVRDAGFQRWDTFTPYPIHGIERAMGIPMTVLPWIVLGAGLTGCVGALGMQWWMNAVDYPFVISGKPFWSVPANIPITFELTVLLSAITAFLSMLLLNRLPHPAHPLDLKRRFAKVTDNRFFLLVEASDPKFDAQQTRSLLDKTHPTAVEAVDEDVESPDQMPRLVSYGVIILTFAAAIPFALAYKARHSTSRETRIHIVPDMDFQQKFKSQRENPFFADHRALRAPVEGTVALGDLREDDTFYEGKAGADFTRTLPAQVEVSDATMERGRQRFGIYCTPCHGQTGQGTGLVAQHAGKLGEGTWVPPSDLRQDYIRVMPVGQIFNTITNGIRNMPAYGRQIPPQDRWAIILYLRALQRSQAASLTDVPEAARASLQ